jgi:hypothetical protein
MKTFIMISTVILFLFTISITEAGPNRFCCNNLESKWGTCCCMTDKGQSQIYTIKPLNFVCLDKLGCNDYGWRC